MADEGSWALNLKDLAMAVLGWAGNTIAGRFSEGAISPLALVFLRWTIVVAVLVAFRAKDMIASWPG
jgi:hypothetical protein